MPFSAQKKNFRKKNFSEDEKNFSENEKNFKYVYLSCYLFIK